MPTCKQCDDEVDTLVTVKVDGTQVVLQSAILSREPAVAT